MERVNNICTGCGLCVHKCPYDAIKLLENEHGDDVAVIASSLCRKCGICVKICPEINKPVKTEPIKGYAAWSKSAEVYSSTTSGGIATTLSETVIQSGGVVYGASFSKGYVKHIRICHVEALDKIKGSKYIQSNISDVFSQIEVDLKNGLSVLFIGTPCQTSAIKKAFLHYKELICIDLVCHGTPPKQYFFEYISRFKINDLEKLRVSFRNKRYYLEIYEDNREIYRKRYLQDPYFYGFMHDLLIRDNCHTCQYASRQRVSDITLGDFWGISNLEHKSGYPDFVSCILINSETGMEMFNKVKMKLNYEEFPVNQVIERNPNLNFPTKRPIEKDIFYQNYSKYGFNKAIEMSTIPKKIKRNHLRDLILTPYRVLRYGLDYKDKM